MFTFSKNAAQRVMRAVLLVERLHGSAAQAKGPRSVSGKTEHPLQVYLSGGYICVRVGHHIWFDSYANVPAKTDLEKTVGDAWQAYTSGARTVYVKRVYNSDGTATVTLENTSDTYATVAGGITNTQARWILATIADGVITQWWTGGDIYDIRVA